ncbi:hypothetical protein [Nocardia asteroides]|uniref:hypothetical protein n=1 Tax=Nocardia asteroides TaxID=1824 RepID=UPI00343DDC6F
MSEDKYEIGGKIFEYSSDPIDPDLLAEAEAAFARGNALRAQERAQGEPVGEEEPERFHDDMIGTEYEEWYRQKRADRATRDQQR